MLFVDDFIKINLQFMAMSRKVLGCFVVAVVVCLFLFCSGSF